MYADYSVKHGLEISIAHSLSEFRVVTRHHSVWLVKVAWKGKPPFYWLVRPVPMRWGKKTKTSYGYVWKGGYCDATTLPPLMNPRTKKPWKLNFRDPLISVPVKGGKQRAW